MAGLSGAPTPRTAVGASQRSCSTYTNRRRASAWCQLRVGKGRLVIPKHGDVVLLGGAEGLVVGGTGKLVVGGTGKYATAGGPYSTRLKLETIGGLFAYYDELFFRFREVDVQ